MAEDEELTLTEVLRLTSLSRATLFRRAAAGTFPPRGYANNGKSRAVVWKKSDIDAWLKGGVVARRPEMLIEGATFRLPEYPNMQRATAAVRHLALYAVLGRICPTRDTRAVVFVRATPGRDPREELRDLRTFLPSLKFSYFDETGSPVDLDTTEGAWLG